MLRTPSAVVGGDAVYVLDHAPGGYARAGGTREGNPGWAALAAASGVPPDLVDLPTLDRRIAARRAALLARPGGYSETGPAVLGWSRRGDDLWLRFFDGDYAGCRELLDVWGTLPGEVRESLLAPAPGLLLPLFAHSVSLSVSVSTSDRRLMLGRRRADMAWGDQWELSASEGVSSADMTGGTLDLFAAVHRALAEEAGLDTRSLPVLAHTWTLDAGSYILELSAHVDLAPAGLTAADVRAAHDLAPDGWETAELADVEYSAAGIAALLGAPRDWVATVPVGLAGLAAATCGADLAQMLSLIPDTAAL